MSKTETLLGILLVVISIVFLFTLKPEDLEQTEGETTAETVYEETPPVETEPPVLEFTDVNEIVYVLDPVVSLYDTPDTRVGSIIGSVRRGDAYRRVRCSDSWSVILSEGRECYVRTECLTTENPDKITIPFRVIEETIQITVGTLSVWERPTATARAIAVVHEGNTFRAIAVSENGEWYKIWYTTRDGRETIGYVSSVGVTVLR